MPDFTTPATKADVIPIARVMQRAFRPRATSAGDIAVTYGGRDLDPVEVNGLWLAILVAKAEHEVTPFGAFGLRVLVLFPDTSRLSIEVADGKVRIRE
jgi:hypothetical protein